MGLRSSNGLTSEHTSRSSGENSRVSISIVLFGSTSSGSPSYTESGLECTGQGVDCGDTSFAFFILRRSTGLSNSCALAHANLASSYCTRALSKKFSRRCMHSDRFTRNESVEVFPCVKRSEPSEAQEWVDIRPVWCVDLVFYD